MLYNDVRSIQNKFRLSIRRRDIRFFGELFLINKEDIWDLSHVVDGKSTSV